MTRFYTSRHLLDSFVYVQEDGLWRSYSPGGAIYESTGEMPQSILNQVEEISSDEAAGIIDARTSQAPPAGSPPPDYRGYLGDGPTGIGGWIVLPIIGLVFTIFTSLAFLFAEALPMVENGVWAALTTPGSTFYHPAWAPLILVELFSTLVLLVASVFLLILLFRKNWRLPQLIIWFYAFYAFYIIVDSVVILAFGARMLPDPVERETLGWSTGAIVSDLARGLLPTAIWIPYFLLSTRVKNTFVKGRSEARFQPPAPTFTAPSM